LHYTIASKQLTSDSVISTVNFNFASDSAMRWCCALCKFSYYY